MAKDVQFHREVLDWLGDSDDSPIADVLGRVADLVLTEAISEAPFSLRGSYPYSPPGFVKSRIVKSRITHDDGGALMVLVGSRLNRAGGAYPFPIAFVANDAGSTWNRGHRSRRKADNHFLKRALELAPFTIQRA
jgi:hypothetical protein